MNLVSYICTNNTIQSKQKKINTMGKTKTISELRREKAAGTLTLYQQAAIKFGVTYEYVAAIARGKRKAIRGKGLEVKEFLLSELSNN